MLACASDETQKATRNCCSFQHRFQALLCQNLILWALKKQQTVSSTFGPMRITHLLGRSNHSPGSVSSGLSASAHDTFGRETTMTKKRKKTRRRQLVGAAALARARHQSQDGEAKSQESRATTSTIEQPSTAVIASPPPQPGPGSPPPAACLQACHAAIGFCFPVLPSMAGLGWGWLPCFCSSPTTATTTTQLLRRLHQQPSWPACRHSHTHSTPIPCMHLPFLPAYPTDRPTAELASSARPPRVFARRERREAA
ncbi:hypothetical protein IWZ01DRAFT_155937 [Phyllosticta capitalensis]